MSLQKSIFGTLPDGSDVELYHLSNSRGLECKIMTLGGIITELHVPDREGRMKDIALGLPTLEDYLKGHPHFGALTGRVAGRINGAEFTLNGKTYPLAENDPPNHLHGGPEGIDKRNWKAVSDDRNPEHPVLTLCYDSPDGEMGYPGNVSFKVNYSLTPDQTLQIEYLAKTDIPTPISLTNHSYFNLKGEGTPDVSGHELRVNTDTYIPKMDNGTLTDKRTSVEDTDHDFRKSKPLKDFADLHHHGEHYILRNAMSEAPEPAAVLTEKESGRQMEVWTNTTAVQLYVAQTLGEGGLTGKSGKPYLDYSAVCLECQGYPNGVNCPEIDNIILQPEETYRQITQFKFKTVPSES